MLPGWTDLAVAGRTDAGVHATGQVASSTPRAARRSRGTPRRSTRRSPTTSPSSPPRRRRTASTHGSRRGRARTATSCSRAASARRSRRAARSGGRDRVDDEALAAARRTRRRRARLHRVHADRDAARGLPPRRARRAWESVRRRAPLHHHRGLVPAAHGADARRDDARDGARGIRASCSRAGRAPRRARPRRHGASISSGRLRLDRSSRLSRRRGAAIRSPHMRYPRSSSSTSTAR